MDVQYQLQDMQFEWDENKDRINRAKYGLSFKTAATVFADYNRIEYCDTLHSSLEEIRYITIGMLYGKIVVVTVVYTEKADKYRIVSARKATFTEMEEYFNEDI